MRRGLQRPRIQLAPNLPDSAGDDVVEFAAAAGLFLDPWQQHVLRHALCERADGQWASFEVGLIVARQNGKGAILEALELAWLFLFDERKVLHSAHELKTAIEAFKRIRDLCQANPVIDSQVANYYQSNERTAIELHNGAELRFIARSKGSGRGFSADKVIFDEAYNLPESAIDAMLPTVGARPNPQIWYTSSAGDYMIAPCDVLARLRDRGIAGEDQGLAFFEWSVEYDERTRKITGRIDDPRLWAQANPSMGIRKTEERIAKFQTSMSMEGFAREELSVGNWPIVDESRGAIDFAAWKKLHDPKRPAELDESKRTCLAVAVAPDKSWATIGTVGRAVDGRELVLVQSRRGIGWVAAEVARLVAKHRPLEVALNPATRAGALLGDLREAGVEVRTLTARETQQACGAFQLGVSDGRFAHVGQAELDRAVRAAKLRDRGDAEDWDTRHGVDLSPLQAVTIAAASFKERTPADYDLLDSIG